MANPKHKRLFPLLKWPGGKYRIAKRLIPHFPEHTTYVEPFAGGASIFFQKPPAEYNVLGDLDPYVWKFYRDARNGKMKKCRGGIRNTDAVLKKAEKSNHPCFKMAHTMMTYQGKRSGSFRPKQKIIATKKMKNLAEYERRLRKAHIVGTGFDETMRRFDGPDAFHFLDPPWPLASKYSEQNYHGGKTRVSKIAEKNLGATNDRRAFDPFYVKNQCNKLEGAVMMIYGDHPDVRAMMKEAQKEGWDVRQAQVDTFASTSRVMKPNLIAMKPYGRITKKKRRRRSRRKVR